MENMRESLLGFLRKHRVEGWDGHNAEPLSKRVYSAAEDLVDALPDGNFVLHSRGSNEQCLVWAEIHHAPHEDTPVFRFYADPKMFNRSHFSVTVMRNGRYMFEFETELGHPVRTRGVTNSGQHVVKMLAAHLSDLGDLRLEGRAG